MFKILKRRAKGSLLGHFSAPGPTRKLRVEVTSSPGRARCEGAEEKAPASEIKRFLVKLVRKRRKKKKKTRLRHFRNVFVIVLHRFSPFFVLHSMHP
ncbi:hypothetical protein GmHk_03G007150 [Glycine max]|nr:hypothetical protein GmHk_03G007150 [Glycine max]